LIYTVKYILLIIKYGVRQLALCLLMLFGTMVFPLEAQQKATRQSALDAFNKGKFDLAYNHFTELLVTFPKDPVYRYYSGVCLVKMQKDPEEATDMLLQARRDGAVVRSVPQDALFWLGRAQQMAGRFTDAIASYDEYTELAGRKTAREMGTPEFIKQCREKKGQLTMADIITARATFNVEAEVKVEAEAEGKTLSKSQ